MVLISIRSFFFSFFLFFFIPFIFCVEIDVYTYVTQIEQDQIVCYLSCVYTGPSHNQLIFQTRLEEDLQRLEQEGCSSTPCYLDMCDKESLGKNSLHFSPSQIEYFTVKDVFRGTRSSLQLLLCGFTKLCWTVRIY